MPLSMTCPSCGLSGKVPDSLAGTQIKCPKCAFQFRAPASHRPGAIAQPASAASLRHDEPEEQPKQLYWLIGGLASAGALLTLIVFGVVSFFRGETAPQLAQNEA